MGNLKGVGRVYQQTFIDTYDPPILLPSVKPFGLRRESDDMVQGASYVRKAPNDPPITPRNPALAGDDPCGLRIPNPGFAQQCVVDSDHLSKAKEWPVRHGTCL